MLSASRLPPALTRPALLRAGASAAAALVALGALSACSSEDSSSSDSAALTAGHDAPVEYTKPPAPTDPNATPANEADSAAISTVINVFYDASNAEDADTFLSTLCEAVLPEYEGIENGSPVGDPIVVADIADIAVNSDAGTATASITIAMGKGSAEQSQAVPYKFTRAADGQWKVCGSPE